MVVGPALLLCLALSPPAVKSPQEQAAMPREQARQILDSGHYQQTPPASLARDADGRMREPTGERTDPQEPRRSRSGGSSGFVHAPLLVPIVVGVLLLVLLLLGVTRRGGLAEERVAVPFVASPAAADPGAPFEGGDPEALAAQGRFAEAIHALLLRALRGLARALGGFARGLTSREILPRAPAGAPRAALEELVGTVERHEFGAQPLSAADFERCRSAAALLPAGAHGPVAKPVR
jgi:hypothetical protein